MTALLGCALILGAGALAAQPPAGIPGHPETPAPGPAVCPGEISDLLSGSALDPNRRGFLVGQLDTDEFRLEDYAVRSEGDCGDDSLATDAALVANTTWRDRETGMVVGVRQTEAARHANVLKQGTATFWSKGAGFSVIVGRFGLQLPSTKDTGLDGIPRPDDPSGGGGGGGEETSPQEILERAIADLAPELGLECFYTTTFGTWNDLADVGIGDPRGQIPSEFFEAGFSLSYLAAPTASCGNKAPAPSRQLAFAAAFITDTGGWMTIDAASLTNGDDPIGQIDEFSATWTNDEYRFSIGGHSQEASLGVDVIKAIASALDPEFSDSCLLHTVELTEAELGDHGYHAAQAPTGYATAARSLTARLLPKACSTNVGAPESFDLFWSFAGSQGRMIDASASSGFGGLLPPFDQAGIPGGGSGSSSLSWSDQDGRFFSVIGYNANGEGPVPTRDQLIEVAESMDPTYDEGSPDGTPRI